MGKDVNWLTDYRLPIGPWAKAVVDWLTTNVTWFFDGLSFIVAHVINALLFLLQAPHPLIVVVVFAAVAYGMRRSVGVTALTFIGLLITINQGYWKETTETLPPVLATSRDFIVRGYGRNDRIVYGTGAVTPTGDIPAYAASLLERLDVAYIHVRSARNNCYQCRIDTIETPAHVDAGSGI